MTGTQSRIAELAAQVAQHTQRIDDYLNQNGLPHPSFHAESPSDLGLQPDIEHSRTVVLRASQELNDLLQHPRDLLFNHHHNVLVYLQLISRFDIASKVPVDGEITFNRLATVIGMDEGSIARILRLGIAYRIFREPRYGVIAHSAASRQIADDACVADWIGASVDDMWPAAHKVVDALTKWPQAAEPTETGFALANDTNLPFHAVLAQNPQRARRFGGAMSFFTKGDGLSLRHLTDGYPWAATPSGTVVDIGGSHGDAAFALARKYPDLHIIVQDLPEVVANARQLEGLNVEFMAHDFFDEQPVKGAEVYYYRHTLHNWPDKYCTKTLRALIPALKTGARLLIMDMLMPLPGALPNDLDRKLRAMDLTMLEIGNAKERDLNDWKGLLEKIDTRYQLREVYQPPGSTLSIVEVVWKG